MIKNDILIYALYVLGLILTLIAFYYMMTDSSMEWKTAINYIPGAILMILGFFMQNFSLMGASMFQGADGTLIVFTSLAMAVLFVGMFLSEEKMKVAAGFSATIITFLVGRESGKSGERKRLRIQGRLLEFSSTADTPIKKDQHGDIE